MTTSGNSASSCYVAAHLVLARSFNILLLPFATNERKMKPQLNTYPQATGWRSQVLRIDDGVKNSLILDAVLQP